jgi:lipoprotein LprG
MLLRLRALTALVTVALVAGCSGGSGSGGGPDELLTGARAKLDQTNSVHFTLTSADVPGGGTRLTGGAGVIARPASFQGKLALLLNGSQVSVDLTSVNGKVYAKLPFSATYQVVDPATFGLSDPARLIDARTGVSQMFTQLKNMKEGKKQRIGGDVVTEVDGTLPGTLVDDLLTSADPAQPVQAALFVTETKELRQVRLTGPFFVKGTNSTFTLLLDRYGQKVTIAVPTS